MARTSEAYAETNREEGTTPGRGQVVSLIERQRDLAAEQKSPSAKELASICRGFERAKAIRQPWEGKFDDCFRYAMPYRQGWFTTVEAENRTFDIFDETAVVATQEFASRLQDGITPNYSRWCDLIAGVEVPEEEQKDVNDALDEVTEYLFEILNASNFSQESHEAMLDLAVTLGALEICEGDALTPIRFKAVPIQTLYVENGVYGGLDNFYRLQSLTLDDLEVQYRGYDIPKDVREAMIDDKPFTFLEAVRRDWDEPAVERWRRTLLIEKDKHEVWSEVTTGIGSGPIVAFRWAKGSGETWGRGPLLNVMPAVKTANMVVELVLENAELAIAGIYSAEDDGTMNVDTIKLVPGTVVPTMPGSGGLKRVDTAANFNVADLVLQDMRGNIKRGLYNDMLGNPEKTPMSATEVSERMADLSRQIGSAYGRMLYEYAARVVQRCIWILRKRGLIELPAVNGRTVKVRATSPLAQAQNAKDIMNVDRLVGFVQQRFGPQMANVFLKGEDIVPYVAKKLQTPEDLTRSKAEIGQAMQAAQQMAQQMQGGEPIDAEAAIAGTGQGAPPA